MTLRSGQPKQLVICADDYAISPAVSAGIRELGVAGRLSATGVMTCMPAWPDEAPALRTLGSVIAVGLHLTLTDQHPLGAMPRLAPDGRLPSVGRLFSLSFAGRLPVDEVAEELVRQLDSFEAHFGRRPDFVDGHQHVHLLPGVRDAVLALFGPRLDPRHVWLRDCTDHADAIWKRGCALKAGVVATVGRSLAKSARARRIALNRGFSGFYDPRRKSLGEVLDRMLAEAVDGHLLMVHPGHVDDALKACDSLTDSRQAEWDTLMAADFPARLAARGFAIASGAACP